MTAQPEPVEVDLLFGEEPDGALLYVGAFLPDGSPVDGIGRWHVRPEGLRALRVRLVPAAEDVGVAV